MQYGKDYCNRSSITFIQFQGSTFEDYCDNVVFLHEKASRSQEQIFAADPSYLQLLGWRMSGHPNDWSLRMAYLSFYC